MGGAQTGGVYEAEEVAAYGHRLFHGVAGGAGDVGDYGAVITCQGVRRVLLPALTAPTMATEHRCEGRCRSGRSLSTNEYA